MFRSIVALVGLLLGSASLLAEEQPSNQKPGATRPLAPPAQPPATPPPLSTAPPVLPGLPPTEGCCNPVVSCRVVTYTTFCFPPDAAPSCCAAGCAPYRQQGGSCG